MRVLWKVRHMFMVFSDVPDFLLLLLFTSADVLNLMVKKFHFPEICLFVYMNRFFLKK